MQGSDLVRYIQQPSLVDTASLDRMDTLLRKYPYFQALHILVARGNYLLHLSGAKKKIYTAMLYATDRKLLKNFIHAVKKPTVPSYAGHYNPSSAPAPTQNISPSVSTPPTVDNRLAEEVRERLEELQRNLHEYERQMQDYDYRRRDEDAKKKT